MVREEKKEKWFFYLMFAGLVFGGLLVLQACAPTGDPLAGTVWELKFIGKSSLIEDTAISLTFEDGQAGGSACNSYGGEYTLQGEKLSFDNLFMTEMYCMDPEGVMEQESRYLDALSRAISYEISRSELWITLDDGDVLTFTAAQ
ncbi:MAG: META domain-containing protein [Anaerolineae bacterium]|nr:META domain-containing protein [Anaerolineae bacterium]